MIIPIVTGAILGLAFDMFGVKIKSKYIFDPTDIQANLQTIPRTFTQSQYRLVSSSSEATDLLNVDGELSLRVKNGNLGLNGFGKYLTKTVNREKTVEMLITVNHETLTETFPSYCKLRTDWQKLPQKDVGTHYVRSITYGGQLIISYQLKATKDEYMEDIKAAVNANLAISGSLDANVTGKLEKLSNAVKDKSTVSISAYATVGNIGVPTNLEACLKLVEDYPALVRKVNNGKGAPLRMDLVDLATVRSNYSIFLKNAALEGLMKDATDKYDDLRTSLGDFRSWRDTSPIWPDEKEAVIRVYEQQLKNANNAMSLAISDLDATKGLDHFDEAFKAYGEGDSNIPNKYSRDLKKVIHTVEEKPFYWFPYTTAVSHYVHWGSTNCSLPSPDPLFIGYAATAPSGNSGSGQKSYGNGGSIECITNTNPKLDIKNLNSTVKSEINGLRYELPEVKSGQIFCSFCKLENATVAYTISGRTECPAEMKLEYSGYLMTSRDAGTGSTFICLDKNSDGGTPKADSDSAIMKPVWTLCPECDEDETMKYVSCVVCSR